MTEAWNQTSNFLSHSFHMNAFSPRFREHTTVLSIWSTASCLTQSHCLNSGNNSLFDFNANEILCYVLGLSIHPFICYKCFISGISWGSFFKIGTNVSLESEWLNSQFFIHIYDTYMWVASMLLSTVALNNTVIRFPQINYCRLIQLSSKWRWHRIFVSALTLHFRQPQLNLKESNL